MTNQIDYKKLISRLSDDLQIIIHVAHSFSFFDIENQAIEIRNRLENHIFTIAVVGEFKRGKSTLINAFLYGEILPTDVLPTTATLNRITYGNEKSVQIFYGSKENQPQKVENIDLNELKNYITTLSPVSEMRASKIREAVIYLPVPLIRNNNLQIIDTPGLCENPTLTKITLDVLPRVDAAIFVIMATSPFSKSEGDFLDLLLEQDLGNIIFIVTAMDLIEKGKRERIIDHIHQEIIKRIEIYAHSHFDENAEEYQQFMTRVSKFRIFGVSGIQALKARISNDCELEKESRFIEFEDELFKKILPIESHKLAMFAQANQTQNLGEILENELLSHKEKIQNEFTSNKTLQSILEEFLFVLNGLAKERHNSIIEVRKNLDDKTRLLPSETEGQLQKWAKNLTISFTKIPDDIITILFGNLENIRSFAITYEYLASQCNFLSDLVTKELISLFPQFKIFPEVLALKDWGFEGGFEQTTGTAVVKLKDLINDLRSKHVKSGAWREAINDVLDQYSVYIETALKQIHDAQLKFQELTVSINIVNQKQISEISEKAEEIEGVRLRSLEIIELIKIN